MSQERYQEALQDFEGVTASNDAEPANWMSKLAVNTQTGLPKATIDNVWIILENDPLLKGKFALNQFAGRGEVLGALPWDDRTERRLWDDNDNQGLYWYMRDTITSPVTARLTVPCPSIPPPTLSMRYKTTSVPLNGTVCPVLIPFSLITLAPRTPHTQEQ